MKNNFYKRLLGGEEVAKVLVAAAEQAKTDFSTDASELDGNEVTQFSLDTIKNVRTYGTEYTLLVGMLLEMHRQLTLKENGIFNNVLEDIGMSKTQAYRFIAVWKKCGRRLASNSKLTAMFVPEALKLLCEPRVPEKARMEAFELAESGKQVNIQMAKSTCAKHLPKGEEKPIASVAKDEKREVKMPGLPSTCEPSPKVQSSVKSMPKSRRSLLSFVGDFARLVVQAQGKSVDVKAISKQVLADVIRDTEKFLAEMRRQHAMMKDNSELTKEG